MKLVLNRLVVPKDNRNSVSLGFMLAPNQGQVGETDGVKYASIDYEHPLEALADAGRFLEMAMAAVQADARRGVHR